MSMSMSGQLHHVHKANVFFKHSVIFSKGHTATVDHVREDKWLIG